MKEKEVKIRLPDPRVVHKLTYYMKTLGAKQIGVICECNHILDLDGRPLKKNGCMLRVRENLNCSAPSVITFKGPAEEPIVKGVKIREEIEAPLQSPQAVIRLLSSLGFGVVCTYAKERAVHELFGVMVQIDKIPELGCFVEIECSEEKKIKNIIKICRLERFERIKESYADMMENYLVAKACRTDL